MEDLLKVPDDQRDAAWEERFFHALVHGKLKVLSPDPQQGPDGWPYLLAATGDDATEPAGKVVHWLSEKGIGLVVNPQRDYPDFVFNYGMIWNFKETGLFTVNAEEAVGGSVELKAGQSLLAGPPNPKYLPDYVRGILRDFFRDQGLFGVKILVISQDGKHFDLAFSLESLGNPPEREHQGIGEAVSWFLPAHYSILLVSEKGLPDFIAL